LRAQSIYTNQVFPGIKINQLSKEANKMGWIQRTGNYYSHFYMDTLLSVSSFVDSTLISSSFDTTGNYASAGVTNCANIMNNSDNLLGLFFDWTLNNDSVLLRPSSPYDSRGCYFLYDYLTQQ